MAKSSRAIVALGRVLNGTFLFADKRAFDAAVARWTNGDAVVRLERKFKQRTDPQNRWLHGVAISLIADECGYDRHEREWLRYYLLGLCFGTEKNALGQDMPKAVGTRKLSTEQFSTFMEWIVRFGATTLNVRIPLPDDPICDEILAEDEGAA
jgi:hypothetical protein